jgi:chromosome segregation ATPase
MQLVYKNYANILERSFATESGAAWTKIQNMGFGSQFKQYLNNLKIDSEEGYKKAYEDIESNYTKFIDGLQSLELAKAGGIFDESQYDSYAEYIQGITKYLSDHPEVTSQVLDIAFGLTFEIKDDNIKIADKEIEDIKERIQKQINTSGEDINFDEVWEYLSNNFSSDEINKILEKGININWKDILASETSKNQATAVIKEILSQAVGTTVDETEITDADLEGLGATTKKKITELKEEISDYAKYLQEAAKESDKIDDSLENNATAAKKVAIANTRLNKGLEDLQKNFEGYKDSLQNSEKGTAEYAKALNELKDDMANVLNLSSGDVLSNDFFEGEQGVQNLKDIEAAANGDIEAIERLRKAASEDIVQQIIVNLNDQNAIDDLKSLTNTLENYAANNNLEIGARLDNASFIDSLNDIINATKMTAEQAGNYLKAMGYDAEVSYDETRVPSTMQMPSVRFAVKADENGTSIIAEPDFTEVEYEQVVRTPVVKALTYTGSAGGTVNYKNTAAGGATTNKSKKSGGGSGSKTKEPKKEKNVKDEIDRYHDINLELKDTSESLNRIQKAEKNLIGEELIDNLNKQLDILEKQKKIYEEKLKLEKEEAKEIQEALKTQGVLFADGDLGYITNYTAVLQAKLDYVNDIIAQYNAMSAEEQEGFKDTVDQAKEDYEDFKKQIESYDTLISDTIPGLEDDIQDAVDKQVEIQIKQFTMEVDVRLDMAEAERDFNKFRKKVIDKIEDDDILGNAKADLDDLLTYFGPVRTT